ncbi:MAG: NAD(P)H-binding protein [Bryobacteraceae bacterium]
MNSVLVIGSTGNIGSHVVRQLCAKGDHVRAMTRNASSAYFPREVEIVKGDITVPETVDRCLEGMDSVFLVWTAGPATVEPVLQRIAGHVRRVVFLSSPHKTAHPFFQQPNPIRNLHLAIEQVIETSGLQWTFLRPGMLATNALFWWAPQIRAGNVVRWPFTAVPTAPIHPHDVAAVAVQSLCKDGHTGAEYVLTGPQSLTQLEQIHEVGRAIARPLRTEEISPEDARRELRAIMPASIIEMLLDAWAAAIGRPAFISSTVEEITGAPARTLFAWATENAEQFRG